MSQPAGGLAVVHILHPGDVACGERGDRLETLLGSCVAIILTDPRRTLGAMCHIVHSTRGAGAAASAVYADVALATMYALLRARGIEPQLCEAYVFGGGNMFPGLIGRRHVGHSNVQWALEALAGDGVPVLQHHVGGSVYRRLRWTVGPTLPQVTAVQV